MSNYPFTTIRDYVLAITVTCILGGLVVPMGWVQEHIAAFSIILILGGIPHGAADYLIYRQLPQNENTAVPKRIFLFCYLGVIALYGLLWWKSPLLAFTLFILISLYHFGQSNWQYVDFDNSVRRIVSYLLWGALVIIFPVLLYLNDAAVIIYEITGWPLQAEVIRWPAIFLIIALNLINIVHLFEAELITARDLSKELVNIMVLVGLFSTTPLLIGFGIYFLCWHSLGSVLDQLSEFRKRTNAYNLKHYLREIIPITIAALTGLAMLYWWIGDDTNYASNLGLLFCFISIITVPHSILMDLFYMVKTRNSKKHENQSIDHSF